jgi:enterochelin esterase-like enzyme
MSTSVQLRGSLAARRCRTIALTTLLSAGLVAGAVAGAATSSAAPTPQGASSQVGADNSFSPQLKHTGKAPTGYTVTFRYRDPSATRVQIKGEWYFSSPSKTTGTSSQGLLPKQWRPGDFPIASPNATAANWPVQDLKENRNGVWKITVPLPSGVFTYGFFVNCASDAGIGCTEVSDPANPPWNDVNGTSTGSVEPDSEIYVPSDSAFGTKNFGYEKPSKVHGNLVDVSYPTSLSTSPVGSHPLVVYTPPNYDASRKQAYPTLYLSHGGGGLEVDWSTQGAAGNILDNLISSGKIAPMVVVMTNFNNLAVAGGTSVTAYSQDLIDNVIPYVQQHYDVATSAKKRAFGGLSAGGQRANDLLFNHTAEFGAYSVMSTGGGVPTSLTAAQVAALKKVQIQVGGGLQDPIRANTLSEQAILAGAKVPFIDDSINGGHEWYVWRILLHDFLLRAKFATV